MVGHYKKRQYVPLTVTFVRKSEGTNVLQHLAVPLVMQFLTGSTMVGMFTVSIPIY